ncbi:MAG: SDR family NAD(P)-dependent oxidoreductase [Alphaproteobacteria bacterium]|jgi:NAD(P)-dependent dehydrogenase (short-subunit alcohol dehydrogenase family)|nr:SDR family NAD(P)-dependent oxidoreductase [Alphaproteobacteria bacterium]MDP6238805.1 SDR family NAD(P)-dependent oxidoreductase [Alphaproteobacteria bacterium]MDP7173892.1 SDR family NAD(P)-dependent oxidoreductase [Alphaproteobacteria bacterium]MDP7234845.1 SDR family NAD(P)-dependent oxidoreductase [Alphaproteobacteria bacterium]MDP7487471.1 SDR family NAD(P)-dependent oxidoreductase [Alphaproteobacteria bacterium]|tara:strand:- start:1141 stop:1896 length:756 start_codon:yes stop_codon:yes gene_type:complete
MERLRNKVALITGAAGGIGAAAARLFAKEGAKLVLVDIEEGGMAKLAGDDIACVAADVSNGEAMRSCVAAAEKHFGGLDIALLNAGIEGVVQPIADYPEETFDRVIAVNLRGVWLGLKHTLPAIARRGGGSIVLTSSIAGVRGREGMSAYVASKHGVIGLMRSAALEGGPEGVRVNSINPSPVETRMMRSLEAGMDPDDPEGVHARYARSSPLGRYAEPEEIAKVMLFLAADESSHCSGSVYMVDGARNAR